MVNYGNMPGEVLIQIVAYLGLEDMKGSLRKHRLVPICMVNRHWRRCLLEIRHSRLRITKTKKEKMSVSHLTKHLTLERATTTVPETMRLFKLVVISIDVSIPLACISNLVHLELFNVNASKWMKLRFPMLKVLVLCSLSGIDQLRNFLSQHTKLESLSIIQECLCPPNLFDSLLQMTSLKFLRLPNVNIDCLDYISSLRPDIQYLDLQDTKFVIQEWSDLAAILIKFNRLLSLDLRRVSCGISILAEPSLVLHCTELKIGTNAFIQSLPIRSLCYAYRNLKSLIFEESTPLSDHALQVIISRLPNLETLELPICMRLVTPSTLMSIPTRLKMLSRFKGAGYPFTLDCITSFALHGLNLTQLLIPFATKNFPSITYRVIEMLLDQRDTLEILDIRGINLEGRLLAKLQKQFYRTLILY